MARRGGRGPVPTTATGLTRRLSVGLAVLAGLAGCAEIELGAEIVKAVRKDVSKAVSGPAPPPAKPCPKTGAGQSGSGDACRTAE